MLNSVTKYTEEVSITLEKFLSDYNPSDHDIIAACVGPAPNQYDIWGKAYDRVHEWALHIHVNHSNVDECKLPRSYDGYPVMVFYNIE